MKVRQFWPLILAASTCACDDDDSNANPADGETDAVIADSSNTSDGGTTDASNTGDDASEDASDALDASDANEVTDADASDADASDPEDASDADADSEIEPCAEGLNPNEICISESGSYPGSVPAEEGKAQDYRLQITERSTIDFKVTGADGTACPNGGMTVIVTKKDGSSWTQERAPIEYRGGECRTESINLQPGEYRISVSEFEHQAEDIVLHVQIEPYQTCGNGIYDEGEICDDGNRIDNDGCNSDCKPTPGYECTAPTADTASTCRQPEPGDSCASAIEVTEFPYQLAGGDFCGDFTSNIKLSGYYCANSTNSPASPEVVFKIDLQAGDKLTVSEHGSLDSVISILDGECGASSLCKSGYSSDLGSNESAGITYIAAADETVYAVVESYYPTCSSSSYSSWDDDDDDYDWYYKAASPYDIRISKQSVVCGDGEVEGNEKCDTGSTTSEGCVNCQVANGWACTGTTNSQCHQIECGDGKVEGNEQCDTGSTPSEGCEECEIAEGWTCSGAPSQCHEIPPGDNCANAIEPDHYPYQLTGNNFENDFDDLWAKGTGCAGGTISNLPPEVIFKIDVQENEVVNVSEHGNLDAVISILEGSCEEPVCRTGLSSDYGEETGITYTATADTTIYAVVESYYGPSSSYYSTTSKEPYNIIITKRIPGCGDGIIDMGEVCDDGNNEDDDGCSADCTAIDDEHFTCTKDLSKVPNTTCVEKACGNGHLENGETCDDGNEIAGDGCDDNCDVEDGFSCTTDVSPSVCYHTGITTSADSCNDAAEITVDRFRITGSNFGADFTHQWSKGTGCTGGSDDAPEAIFKVPVHANEVVQISEHGALDSVLSILEGSCETTCQKSNDLSTDESKGITYTATEDGVIYLVVESYYSGESSQKSYDIRIVQRDIECGDGRVEGSEQCDLGVDENGDEIESDACISCEVQPGYACTGSPSSCVAISEGDACTKPKTLTFVANTAPNAASDSVIASDQGDALNASYDDYWAPGTGCGITSTDAPEIVYAIQLEKDDLLTVSTQEDNALYGYAMIVTGDCNAAHCAAINGGYRTNFSTSYQATSDETVYAILEAYSSYYSSSAYAVQFEKHKVVCGNGIVEGIEECDDGAEGSEACSNECKANQGFSCFDGVCYHTSLASGTGESCAPDEVGVINTDNYLAFGEDFRTFANAYQMNGTNCSNYSYYFDANTPTAVYAITLDPGDILEAQLEADAYGIQLALVETCESGAACLDSDYTTYSPAVSISYTADEAKTVYLFARVSTYTYSASYTYSYNYALLVTKHQPECGDGKVEGSEECDLGSDDNGRIDSDACNNCMVQDGYACTGSPSNCVEIAEGDGCSKPKKPNFIANPSDEAPADSMVADDSGSISNFKNYWTAGADCSSSNSSEAAEIIYEIELAKDELLTVSSQSSNSLSGYAMIIDGSCKAGHCAAKSGYYSTSFSASYLSTADEGETVYAVIEAYSYYATSDFAVQFEKHKVVCGDGIKEGKEECDDGNASDRDGCDASCKVEDGYICDESGCSLAKDGDTCSAPIYAKDMDGMVNGYGSFTISNDPSSTDSNWSNDYTPQWKATGSVCQGSYNSASASDVIILLELKEGDVVNVSEKVSNFDATISYVAQTEDYSCDTACIASIDGSHDVEAAGLTYTAKEDITLYAIVESYAATANYPYEIVVDIHRPVCGDGKVEGTEECDDGNEEPGDGCDAFCEAEEGFSCTDDGACYNTQLTSGTGASCESAGVINLIDFNGFRTTGEDFSTFTNAGQYTMAGSDCANSSSYFDDTTPTAVYAITLDAGDILEASLDADAYAAQLAVVETCASNEACLASDYDTRWTTAPTASISYTADATKTVYLFARVSTYTYSSSYSYNYALLVTKRQVTCGDGLIEGDEECEDGNTIDGDGCTACKVDANFVCNGLPSVCHEAEPGDSCKNAIVPDFPNNGYGTVTYGGTEDNFDDLYTDQWSGNTTSCKGSANGPEVFFKLDLITGDVVTVKQTGDADVVISYVADVDGTCGSVCLASSDTPETLTHIASAAETIYAIVAAYSSSTSYAHRPFNIIIEKSHPECGNGTVETGEDCDGVEGCTDDCKAEDGYSCIDNVCIIFPDHCSDAVAIESGNTVTFNTSDATNTMSAVSACASYSAAGNDLFYKITVPAGNTLTATLSSDAHDDLIIYLLTSCSESACVNGDNDYTATATYTNNTDADQVIYIGCDSYGTYNNGLHSLTVTLSDAD